MAENIIQEVKQAETKIKSLDQSLKNKKNQLNEQMTQELKTFQKNLENELVTYKEQLKLENQNALEKQHETLQNKQQIFQEEIKANYEQNKDKWIRLGIEEVMRTYGHRPNETVDNRQ